MPCSSRGIKWHPSIACRCTPAGPERIISRSRARRLPLPTFLPSSSFAFAMPYSIGLQSAANGFLSAGFSTQFTLAVIAFLVIVYITSTLQKDSVDSPKSLPGNSLFHIIPFFRRRHDFLRWGFDVTGENIFQFNLLRVCYPLVSHFFLRLTVISRIRSLWYPAKTQDKLFLQPRVWILPKDSKFFLAL